MILASVLSAISTSTLATTVWVPLSLVSFMDLNTGASYASAGQLPAGVTVSSVAATATGTAACWVPPVTFTEVAAGATIVSASVTYGDSEILCALFDASGALVEEFTTGPSTWEGSTLHMSRGYGTFLFPPDFPSAGTYVLEFSSRFTLKKRFTVQVGNPGTIDIGEIRLKYGDFNEDNFISQAEVDTVTSYLGRRYTDNNWCVSNGVIEPYECDFNHNGMVDAADVSLVQGNAGLHGD